MAFQGVGGFPEPLLSENLQRPDACECELITVTFRGHPLHRGLLAMSVTFPTYRLFLGSSLENASPWFQQPLTGCPPSILHLLKAVLMLLLERAS